MTRLFGRIIGGQRLVDTVPGGQWNITSIVASIRLDGEIQAMTIKGPFDASSFEVYVKRILCPSLREGDIVIMDNLRCHKTDNVYEAITAMNAELWFLPPYSPDFNPIENMWSKVKSNLRKLKARTKRLLNRAITDSLELVSAEDCSGWFAGCGY
jgi:transposase